MFEIGDRVRVVADEKFLTLKRPVGTVVGSIRGDGLHVYLIFLEDLKKNTVEFIDPLNPHLEKVEP